MRDALPDIRRRGAELVIVGNGSAFFARTFREDLELDCPVLVDPELRAFAATGLRRGRVEILSPKVPLNALRAFLGGARQQAVQGDPWQLGGTFVIRAGGEVAYAQISREAGDHAPVAELLAALDDPGRVVSTDEAGSGAWPLVAGALSLLVDPTVVLSFDRTGYRIHSLRFDPHDLEVDLHGRHIVLSGGNSGLGFKAALSLAKLGARLTLLCRDPERAATAVASIREQSGNGEVRTLATDMSNLASVRATVAALEGDTVDVLIHNAGALPAERIETADGLEFTWATHVLGPHLLTRGLQPALGRSRAGRVVFVTSGGMYTQRLNLSDPNWERRPYDGVIAYAETKRAQVVLTELWAEELAGTGITVNAMHPGWADTPGVQTSLPTFRRITQAILRTPAEGADTIVWLAASPAAAKYNGELFLDRSPRWKHFFPTTRESPAERAELWELCEARVNAPDR